MASVLAMHVACWVLLLIKFSFGTTVIPTSNPRCASGNDCSCDVSGGWAYSKEFYAIQAIKANLTDVRSTMGKADFQSVYTRMLNLTAQVEHLESILDQEPVSVILPLMKGIEAEAKALRTELAALQGSGSGKLLAELTQRLAQLRASTQTLWDNNIYGQKDDTQEELRVTREQLSNCPGAGGMYNETEFRGDNLPAKLNEEDWCDKYRVSGFQDAETHLVLSAYGMWFKDPYPVSDANRSEIYYRQHATTTWFYRYPNYTSFISAETKLRLSVHYGSSYGLGYVLYKGAIYYQYSNKIYKHNVAAGTLGSYNSLPDIVNLNYMGNTLGTYVDFKVDERGLWAIYASSDNDKKLVISKMDPDSLTIIKTWKTSVYKITACATFMVCGRLYVIDVCTKRLSPGKHHKQYYYDTNNDEEGHESIFLTAKYTHIWELSYNPRERVLFGWDSGHLVAYPVIWTGKHGAVTEPSTTVKK